MFLGEFEYKIDEKGRIPVPPKFRRLLKAGVVLSPGVEGCITVYPIKEWEKLAATLTTGALSPSKLRMLKRAVFAAAFSVDLDGQGRIALPAPLKSHAEIVSEVVIIGANNYLELWNKVRWGEEKTMGQEQAWQLLEGLENR
ncbi:MAG: division/cell wall cluster transcriptional repressor MraZ [Dehalococcoidia bacterium]|nr:division/cell wall cluster transcriptional repressor MraZ [Dehalococcoidia bacterium]